MTEDRTPVVVGVAAVQQREVDPERAAEPLVLMQRALERAAEDAGDPGLLARADRILVPRGFWSYPDPGRWLAETLGAPGARSEMLELGVLQTTAFGRAAWEIAEGRSDVVLIAGGEARFREARFREASRVAPMLELPGREADTVHRPHAPIISEAEIRNGLAMPVTQYSMVENALRAAEKQSLEDHRRDVAELWADMSAVAASNPDAWNREPVSAATIESFGPSNRMLAFPYGRWNASQWNVDQSAGIVLCSRGTAQRLGLPVERRVFPLAVVDSNFMRPLTERAALHRSPGFRRAGERASELTGIDLADVPHREIYSCFPSSVRVQQRELGLDVRDAVTVTGGMAFAGGPLNNFVLQATVSMLKRLRAHPGEPGLVTAVSGVLTKQGVSLWSTEAGPGFSFADVSDAAEADDPGRELVQGGEARGQVASYTVLGGRNGPVQAVLLCDREDGPRQLAVGIDPEMLDRMLREEIIGRAVSIDADGAPRLT